jgi:hypothetical protein
LRLRDRAASAGARAGRAGDRHRAAFSARHRVCGRRGMRNPRSCVARAASERARRRACSAGIAAPLRSPLTPAHLI